MNTTQRKNSPNSSTVAPSADTEIPKKGGLSIASMIALSDAKNMSSF
jgi:hypothetical protein